MSSSVTLRARIEHLVYPHSIELNSRTSVIVGCFGTPESGLLMRLDLVPRSHRPGWPAFESTRFPSPQRAAAPSALGRQISRLRIYPRSPDDTALAPYYRSLGRRIRCLNRKALNPVIPIDFALMN